jgi:hypothetical protein
VHPVLPTGAALTASAVILQSHQINPINQSTRSTNQPTNRITGSNNDVDAFQHTQCALRQHCHSQSPLGQSSCHSMPCSTPRLGVQQEWCYPIASCTRHKQGMAYANRYRWDPMLVLGWWWCNVEQSNKIVERIWARFTQSRERERERVEIGCCRQSGCEQPSVNRVRDVVCSNIPAK